MRTRDFPTNAILMELNLSRTLVTQADDVVVITHRLAARELLCRKLCATLKFLCVSFVLTVRRLLDEVKPIAPASYDKSFAK